MTPMTSHRRRPAAALAIASVLGLSALLAACSASGDSASSGGSVDQGADGSVQQDTGAGAADDSGDDLAAPAADADRQVIQTGDIRMTVKDPQDAVASIVALTTTAGGRIDDRTEQAATADDVGTAQLTIRLPAAQVSSAVDELRTLGTIDQIDLSAQDVTGAATDLDARIHGLEISVARMEDLLSKATTSKDVIEAEAALSERQTNLEQLKSQRALLAEQVAMSTLTIALYGPELAPPAETSAPSSFLGGLSDGWDSLVTVVGVLVVLLGLLLPWLVVGGLITAAVVALVRRQNRRRPPAPGAPEQRVPVGAGVGPGRPPTISDPED